jgi:WD40 repeat protein
VDVDKIEDPVNRAAKIAQISNFGQIPKQLFKDKHPAKNFQKVQQTIADCVFSHATQLAAFQIGTGGAVGSIVFINEVPVMLAPRKVLLYPDTTKYISWGHWDQTLRICAMDTNKVITTIDINHDDDVLCGDMTKHGRLLVTGGTACVVKVWRRPNKSNREKADTLVLVNALCGHGDTVLCLEVSQEWSIIATGSADKTCIIWDLNRFAYVRSFTKHEGPITVVAISPTTGNIATACVIPKGNSSGSILRLWSINGEEFATAASAEKITSAIFTAGMEGVVQNLLITGHENGMIKIYSSWDLMHITTYFDCHRSPISALAISKDCTQLISGDTSGLSVCWSWKKPRDNSFVGIRI